MNEELLKRIEELENFKRSLEASQTIPLSVDQSFKGRFGLPAVILSTKSAGSENKSVNEAGGSIYDVLKPPDAFTQVVISGVTYYIPVFT